MQTLTKLIQSELDRWHNTYPLETLFGTIQAEEVAAIIDTFCQHTRGSAIADCYFYEVSLGIVAGLRLKDGQCIVIKGLINPRPPTYLQAVVRVQRYLRSQNYPCTEPIGGPLPLGLGQAMLEALDDRGEFHDAHDPRWRKPLAELLAQLIYLLKQPEAAIEPAIFDFRLPSNVLWGKPHSNIFDFKATSQGAERIDEIARKAKQILDEGAGDLVVGHGDWSTKHVRYIGEQPHIIYDWDSLTLDKEPAIVGRAAIYYTYIPFFFANTSMAHRRGNALLYKGVRSRP